MNKVGNLKLLVNLKVASKYPSDKKNAKSFLNSQFVNPCTWAGNFFVKKLGEFFLKKIAFFLKNKNCQERIMYMIQKTYRH